MEEVVQEVQNIEKKEEPQMIDYKFGDLYTKCSCGNEDLVVEGIKNGIRFELYTTDKHNIKLGCKKCGSHITLFFKEAAKIEELLAKEVEAERLLEEELQARKLATAKETADEVVPLEEVVEKDAEGWQDGRA